MDNLELFNHSIVKNDSLCLDLQGFEDQCHHTVEVPGRDRDTGKNAQTSAGSLKMFQIIHNFA